jgi:hypothetical protein
MNHELIIHSLSDAHDAAVLLGRLGGKAGSGKAKARTSAHSLTTSFPTNGK